MNSIKSVIFLGFILRLFIAIWNGFFGPSFGADVDALAFHAHALETSRIGFWEDDLRIGWIYSSLLGVLYKYISDAIFFGSLISCIFWYFSAKLILASCKILKISDNHVFKGLLIYVFIPSSILFTSVTLREVYQLFFVNLAVYSVIKVYCANSKLSWLWLVFAVAGMGALHGALMASGVIIYLGVVLIKSVNFGRKISFLKIVAAGFVVITIFVVTFSIFGDFAYNLDAGLLAAVEQYQEGVLSIDARANYRSEIDMSSPLGILLFFPTSLIQYLFEPFPWKITALADIVQVIENVLRFLLIFNIFKVIKNGKSDVISKFLFICYFIVELVWSLGTSNWGTAIRHHIPVWGVLVLLYSYSISKRS